MNENPEHAPDQVARLQFESGLSNIRKAISTRLGGVSAQLNADGISHPSWPAQGCPPDVIPITVSASDAPDMTIEFTSREIRDSWRGIDRADVRRKIGLYANEYERQRVPAVHSQEQHAPRL
jgi:hypothetical protein